MKKNFSIFCISIFTILFFISCQNPFFVKVTKLYTVKFETNCDTIIEPYRTSSVEKVQTLEKTDAIFEGWYTDASFSGEPILFPYELSKDTTLYAKWLQQYTVVFETNGGSAVASNKTSQILESPATTKEGFGFAGWYTDASFSGDPISFPYELSKDTTLYAKWLKKYTVRFDTNGGSKIDSYKTVQILESPEVTQEGVAFAGWYEQSGLEEETKVEFPYTLTQDTVLYAKWLKIYTVEHYQQNTDMATYTLTDIEEMTGSISKQTEARKKSYTGFTAKEFEQSQITADGSTVVKIYYDRNAYTVTFNADHGSGEMAEQIFYYEVEKKLPKNVFTLGDFSFLGWALSERGDVVYSDEQSITLEADTMLYAKWDVTIIDSPEDLNNIRNATNKNYILVSNITMEDKWTPIENFRGTLDGNGYTISNLNISVSEKWAGLFKKCSGTIKNLTIKDSTITSDQTYNPKTQEPADGNVIIGALVGELSTSGIVENCHVINSTLKAWARENSKSENHGRYAIIGGLVGKSTGNIKNCSMSGITIYGFSKRWDQAWCEDYEHACVYAGGILGELHDSGSVECCTAIASNERESTIKAETIYSVYTAWPVVSDTRVIVALGEIIGRKTQKNSTVVKDENYKTIGVKFSKKVTSENRAWKDGIRTEYDRNYTNSNPGFGVGGEFDDWPY